VSSQTIAHYNLLERLGSGALGEVHRARDLKVGRTVALMTIPSEVTSDPAKRERFLREARAATALNHPNIATLFDVVEQGETCYLAYEFAAGPSLRDEMGGHPVNMRRAMEIAAQLADALAEGHSRGLVHGDLRPDNIVITPKGSAKILNFGLSAWTPSGRARAAASSPDGLADDPNGVAGYLSPEQALGGTIDERSDVFSFAVIVYEMLTGRCPFRGATPAATLLNVITLTPPPPSTLTPTLSRDLDALIGRCLAKPVDARPSGALALSSDLRRITSALDAWDNHPQTELIPPLPQRSRTPFIVGAVVIVLLVVFWLI